MHFPTARWLRSASLGCQVTASPSRSTVSMETTRVPWLTLRSHWLRLHRGAVPTVGGVEPRRRTEGLDTLGSRVHSVSLPPPTLSRPWGFAGIFQELFFRLEKPPLPRWRYAAPPLRASSQNYPKVSQSCPRWPSRLWHRPHSCLSQHGDPESPFPVRNVRPEVTGPRNFRFLSAAGTAAAGQEGCGGY